MVQQNPRQLSLFDTAQKKEQTTPPANTVVNDKTAYGIQLKHLNQLRFDTLKYIFSGMHNVNLPQAMLRQLNADEIVAKLYGVGKLKGDLSWQPKPSEDFYNTIRSIDKIAYQNTDILKFRGLAKKVFTARRGDQERRLTSLDSTVQEAFLKSYCGDRIISNTAAKRTGDWSNTFYDPNCDGKNKRLYSKAIYDYLKNS